MTQTLRTASGHLVAYREPLDQGIWPLNTNPFSTPGASEKFWLETHPGGTALRSFNGLYMTASSKAKLGGGSFYNQFNKLRRETIYLTEVEPGGDHGLVNLEEIEDGVVCLPCGKGRLATCNTIGSRGKLPSGWNFPWFEKSVGPEQLFTIHTSGGDKHAAFSGHCGPPKGAYANTLTGKLGINMQVAVDGKVDLSDCICSPASLGPAPRVFGIRLVENKNYWFYQYSLYVDAQGGGPLGLSNLSLCFVDETNDFYAMDIISSDRKIHVKNFNSKAPAIKKIKWIRTTELQGTPCIDWPEAP